MITERDIKDQEVIDWINKNCNLVTSFEYPKMGIMVTKNTGVYISGDTEDSKAASLSGYLAVKHGFTELLSSFNRVQPVPNHAYSEKDGMWYGWSHRAIHGFKIGSEVKKGDIAFKASNLDDFIEDLLDFWKEDYKENLRAEKVGDEIRIIWEYTDEVPNKKLRGSTGYIDNPIPKEWGRGEWVAKTMEDAKQMAIDYANEIA